VAREPGARTGSSALGAGKPGTTGDMKTLLKIVGGLLLLAVILGGAGFAWMASRLDPGLEPGSPAPDVVLATLDETPLPLSELRGKVVLLDFWGST